VGRRHCTYQETQVSEYLQSMEPLLETIDLDIEEHNELAFRIQIEGAGGSPAKVRLVCEQGDMSYMFAGKRTNEDGVIQFVLPPMKDKLTEGEYASRVEVLIENRYFSPVQFTIKFKKTMKVVAEHVQLVPRVAKPEITVVASPIQVKKPAAPVVVPVQKKVTQEKQTLREIFQKKKRDDSEISTEDENIIRELARTFISKQKKR
jgi:hypothetical protein